MAGGWYHEVSAAWLQARKQYFMATDAVKLLPAYKRAVKKNWQPGDVVPEFQALSIEKQSRPIGETKVYGDAARGHIMEPYAVEEWNHRHMGSEFAYHWDDIVVYRDDYGFSPDALPFMVNSTGARAKTNASLWNPEPGWVLEIKSYAPWKFGKITSSGDYHEEKLQLAMAFKVFPKMQNAFLFLYCPAAGSCKEIRWRRTDMDEELKILDGMLEMWRENQPVNMGNQNTNLLFSEERIYEMWQREQEAANGFNLK